MSRFLTICALLILLCAGCNPFYVIRGAYEESKILIARQPIKGLVQSKSEDAPTQQKLALVLRVRDFSATIGLKPGDSYLTYSKVSRDPLLWVLVGSRREAFDLYSWWFPFVGSVPYKGFFDKRDGERAAKILEELGYETWLRGSDAFSTLGWFEDPLLSTMLKYDQTRLAEMVIHESLHRTFWLDDQVNFNESLANFVGFRGAICFFESELQNCAAADSVCSTRQETLLKQARRYWENEKLLAAAVSGLYADLERLYASDVSKEEKLSARAGIFSKHILPLKAHLPKLEILKSINNAEIVQLKLYLTDLPLFEELFTQSGSDWKTFLQLLEGIKAKGGRDPFLAIRDALQSQTTKGA
jgi:predicted aminopeptidase